MNQTTPTGTEAGFDLDLDHLEAQVQRAYMADARCVAFPSSPGTILALIALARRAAPDTTAQPVQAGEADKISNTDHVGRDLDDMPQPFAGAIVLLETIAECGARPCIGDNPTPMREVCIRFADELRVAGRASLAPVSAQQGAAEQPTAWLATDLDGRGDVGFTKEEAKRRAGEGCTEFFPLFDTAAKAPAAQAVTAPAGVTLRAFKGADTKEWHITIQHPFGTSWVRMIDRRDFKLAELLAASPASAPEATTEQQTNDLSYLIEYLPTTALRDEAKRKIAALISAHAQQPAAPVEVTKAELWDAIHQYVSDYGDQFRVPPTTGAGKRCNASRDELAAVIDKLYAAPAIAGAATTSNDARDAAMLNEVADVLAENNWRGDLVEALRAMSAHQAKRGTDHA